MRAARLRRVLLLVRNMTVLLSAGRIRPSLGGIGEGVVEGVEGVVGRDRELEAISDASVLDRDGQPVLARVPEQEDVDAVAVAGGDRKSTRLNSSHVAISYAVFCLKKKKKDGDAIWQLNRKKRRRNE